MRLFEFTAPPVVYHGGPSRFSAFRPPRGEHPSKIGIWFAEDRSIAEKIARQSCRTGDDIPHLYEVSLRVESPKVYQTYQDYLEDWKTTYDAAKLRRKLMRAGHDSVEIVQSDTDGGPLRRDFAAFFPYQIDILRVTPLT